MKNQISWEEIIAQFDDVERQLSQSPEVVDLSGFFATVREYFTGDKFEKWQVAEASQRTTKIMAILEKIKQELYERSSNLERSKTQLGSYIKNSYLVENKE